MDIKDLQTEALAVYREHFGHTSLSRRVDMILDEAVEIKGAVKQGVPELQEEMGDLLSCLLVGIAEQGWDAEQILRANLEKIERRAHQYKSLGRKTQVLILGGAFNPIHLGHIQLAQFALDATGAFDELWLMPCYQHMLGKNDLVDFQHRLAMCQLAAECDGRISASAYEGNNKLAGETFHMVNKLLHDPQYKDTHRFALLIGMDNGNKFDKWVNFEELRAAIPFVVVSRQGIPRDASVDWYLKPPHIFLEAETAIDEVSSTQVRQQIADQWRWNCQHHEPEGLDPKVLQYIEDHKLYGA